MLMLLSTNILVMALDLMERSFSHPAGSFGNNTIIFGENMKISFHMGNKKADILILGNSSTKD